MSTCRILKFNRRRRYTLKGNVFSIEEFSIYDGPGIRITVFLKGCPLRCNWCHNPEGQRFEKEIVKGVSGCIGCNKCIESAVKNNGRIVFTQQSINLCPKGLLRCCGDDYDSLTLCEKLIKNERMLKGGGVTFSGGEPLCQSDFLFECLSQLKGKLHTAIQTSGYCDAEIFKRSTKLADYFLFDLKLANDEMHIKHTGVSNKKIIQNFEYLAASGKPFVVRVPLIPTLTDTDQNILGIIEILKKNNVKYIELLPYNKIAGGKYKMLGREYTPNFDEQGCVKIPNEILKENNIDFLVL